MSDADQPEIIDPLSRLDELLGRFATLRITRLARADALLAAGDEPGAPRIAIPRSELPYGAEIGDRVRVFVHLDADNDVVATTRTPRLVVDEIAFLRVTGVTSFGAFMDWGLPKDLLVHNRFMTAPVKVGSEHAVGLILDDTGRLAGTMMVRELVVPPVSREVAYKVGDLVPGEAWRQEPGLGLFVILEQRYLGLLPAREPHRLRLGERATFRVTSVLPDGKVVLSVRAPVAVQIGDDASEVLAYLRRPGAEALSEAWEPERIARVFGLSKKAFKRAIGRLLRDGQVSVAPDGLVTYRR